MFVLHCAHFQEDFFLMEHRQEDNIKYLAYFKLHNRIRMINSSLSCESPAY